MSIRRWLRGSLSALGVVVLLGASGPAAASGQTDLQQTAPLVEVMFLLSLIGAVLTFGILIWALVKFRDPATKGRRYG
ncbi:MAG TPA: hypothetical protein VFG07_00970 [Thermoplasmata archaeon]|nr:hypothetical protein [Thermoplasmata archaeon]